MTEGKTMSAFALAAAVLLLSFPSAAQEKPEEQGAGGDYVSGSLKMVVPWKERKDTTSLIKTDSSNLRRLPKKSSDTALAAPENSFIAAFAEPDCDYQWSPPLAPGSQVKLRLNGRAMSADRTGLVFLEETGAADGPYGSRFIVFDTIGWKVRHFIEVPYKISSFALDPDPVKPGVWCAVETQETMNQESGLVRFDLRSGKITVSTACRPLRDICYSVYSDRVFGLWAGGGRENNGAELAAFTGEGIRLFKKSRELKLYSDITMSPDGRLLAGADASGMSLSVMETKPIKSVAEISFPERLTVTECAFPKSKTPLVMFSAYPSASITGAENRTIYSSAGDSIRSSVTGTNGKFVLMDDSTTLVCGKSTRNRVARFLIADGSETSFCEPSRLRPGTVGSIYSMDPGLSDGAVIVMDSTGALYSLRNKKMKWVKERVLKP